MAERGVGFRSLQEAIDTTTPGGKLVFHVFAALVEFERDLIRERTMSSPADQTLQHRPEQLSMAAHQRPARRRVDEQGSAVRLKSCTYLGVLPAEWRLGRQ